jgi:hypothetical protein
MQFVQYCGHFVLAVALWPSSANPEDVEATPVFDRAGLAPKIWWRLVEHQYQSNVWRTCGVCAMATNRFRIFETSSKHMHGLFSFCWPLADFLSQYCFSAKWTDVLAFPFLVALGHGTAKPPGNMANTEMSEGNMKGACHSGTAGHRRLFSKGNFGACHALAQSAKQFKRQRLLCRGLGTDRVSRGVDCPADFAFSRLTGRGQPDWRFGIWGSRR